MREREKAEKPQKGGSVRMCVYLVTFNYKCKYVNIARLARSRSYNTSQMIARQILSTPRHLVPLLSLLLAAPSIRRLPTRVIAILLLQLRGPLARGERLPPSAVDDARER